MRAAYFISVFLHILSAIAWLGGTVFFALILRPLGRHQTFVTFAPTLIDWMGKRFRYVAWSSFFILLITGLFNLWYRGLGLASLLGSGAWQGPFGHLLATKLVLVAVIFAISAVHDFYIGPKAILNWTSEAEAQKTKSLRKTASWIGRSNLILGLIVVLIAIMMVRGKP